MTMAENFQREIEDLTKARKEEEEQEKTDKKIYELTKDIYFLKHAAQARGKAMGIQYAIHSIERILTYYQNHPEEEQEKTDREKKIQEILDQNKKSGKPFRCENRKEMQP